MVQVPLLAAQLPATARSCGGSCATNSGPALLPCGVKPVLVMFASTARTSPASVQTAGSVSLVVRPFASNFAPANTVVVAWPELLLLLGSVVSDALWAILS